MLTASCHCGNISMSAESTPETLTSCNCSICSRYGVVWAYFKTAEVTVTIRDEQPKAYYWGDECINFLHCPNCGCVTHYTGRGPVEDQAIDRVAINTRMCPKEQVEGIRVRHFDGADTWTFLD